MTATGKRAPALWRAAPAALACAPLAGCDIIDLTVANHAGPVAAGQWHLYLILGVVLIFVAGPVLILTPLVAWHYRLSNKNEAFRPQWNFWWPLEGFIWIPPTGIVIGLGFVLWSYTHDLDPYRPLPGAEPPLEVQAVALDWKWLFVYPDERVAAVNQLAIPVDRPIRISLTSATVMQSLLVPRLAGQIYAMAGMRTQLNLAASQTGTFHGENAQFNGRGFHNQKFDVIAMSPADYRNWLDGVRASATPLDTAAYRKLLQKSIPAQPEFFSTVPDGFFGRVMTDATNTTDTTKMDDTPSMNDATRTTP